MSKIETWKINLLNLNNFSLIKLIKLIKGKSFYSQEIIKWIYKKNIENIICIPNIKKEILKKINKTCIIKKIKIKKEIISSDNTIKWIIKTNNDNNIETVAIPNNKNHFTLCISSQIGCILNCVFCHTGKYRFKGNLRTNEIINQIYISSKRINNLFFKKKITNIVFMGMGEPLLNIKNILSAIKIITFKKAYNLHKSKITISTSGIPAGIDILNSENIPLALSLHAVNDKLRSQLMPINKKYPLNNILKKCKKYSKKNKLTIEYIMLKKINDSKKDAIKLKYLLKNIKCKICLIPFNSFRASIYETTKMSNIIFFKNTLKKLGIITTIRKKMGHDINGACGQLVG